MKTSKLTGAALDWAVAKCDGVNAEAFRLFYEPTDRDDYDFHGYPEFHYSTVWAQGGPIIERENISIVRVDAGWESDSNGYTTDKRITEWVAEIGLQNEYAIFDDETTAYWIDAKESIRGQTPLIAAMRCYVASKFGDEVEVPEELQPSLSRDSF